MSDKQLADIKNLSLPELTEQLMGLGKEKFRAKQIIKWIYSRDVTSFDEMTDLSKALREDLKKKGSLFGNKKADTASMSDEGPQPMAERAFGGGELIRGLRSTAMRTTRSDMDYETFLATDAGKAAVKRSKKKRFGIF